MDEEVDVIESPQKDGEEDGKTKSTEDVDPPTKGPSGASLLEERLRSLYVDNQGPHQMDTTETESRGDLDLLELQKRIVDKALQSEKGQLDLILCFFLGFSLESNQKMLQGLLPQTKSSSETVEEMKRYLRNFHAGNIPQERCMNLFLCKYELKEERFQDDIRMFLHSGARLSPIDCSVMSTMLQISRELIDELDLTKCMTPLVGVEKLILPMKNCKRAVLKSGHLSDKPFAILLSILQSPDSCLRELCLVCFSNANVSLPDILFAALGSPNCKLQILSVEHDEEHWVNPQHLNKYACDLTYDPNTVNEHLLLSECNREVKFTEEKQPYPDHPERFDEERQGEVMYRTLIWNDMLLQPARKVPAGPLFSIECAEDSIRQLHLPHCEPEPALVSESLAVVNITEDGMSIIQPLEVTDTHVIVDVPHLSSFGIVWDLIKRFLNFITKPVYGQVLLFLRPPLRSGKQILSVILLPSNVPLLERAHFSDNYGPNYHASYEIILRTSTEEVTLMLRDPDSAQVWQHCLHLPASSSDASSVQNLPRMGDNISADEKLRTVRSAFIYRVSYPVLDKLLDELLGHGVITDAEREAAMAKPRRDKARDVIDM
eukprot:superscaffoldBa00005392_g20279